MNKITVLCVLAALVLSACSTVPYTGPLYDGMVPSVVPNTNQSPSHSQVKQGIASFNNKDPGLARLPAYYRGDNGVHDPNRGVDVSKQSVVGHLIWSAFKTR